MICGMCINGGENMALLKLVSDHCYEAYRPSDGQCLGNFRLICSNGVYIFEPECTTFYEGDLRTLQKSFAELNRNL